MCPVAEQVVFQSNTGEGLEVLSFGLTGRRALPQSVRYRPGGEKAAHYTEYLKPCKCGGETTYTPIHAVEDKWQAGRITLWFWCKYLSSAPRELRSGQKSSNGFLTQVLDLLSHLHGSDCLVHTSIPAWTVLILDSVSYLMLERLGSSFTQFSKLLLCPVKGLRRRHMKMKTVCRVGLITPVDGHGAKPCNSATLIKLVSTRLA